MQNGSPPALLELPVHPFLFGAYAVFFLWSRNVDKVRTADTLHAARGRPRWDRRRVRAGLARVPQRVEGGARGLGPLVPVLLVRTHRRVVHDRDARRRRPAPAQRDSSGWRSGRSSRSARIVGAALIESTEPAVLHTCSTSCSACCSRWPSSRRDGEAATNAARAADVASAPRRRRPLRRSASATPAPPRRPAPKRDIYFIILDRYANQQTLEENYDHDNSYFIDGLRDRGFFVASKSRGPYPKTPHSIQTTLNMEFVDLPEGVERLAARLRQAQEPEDRRSS